ncbi:hypothetical protein L226DRAFT_538022 [Lentinus tigrinus ALCF2SS1-7]|uniref:uncharacterized protein n=1 Tax=Lentinus tigrinus ALCF2SS1-7 TaxID=1328758 RepID=UPI0011663507|nr:hypothetical protein L226DRAFT_538022 [Lentinus tigrinus ALCF2SS1-7]
MHPATATGAGPRDDATPDTRHQTPDTTRNVSPGTSYTSLSRRVMSNEHPSSISRLMLSRILMRAQVPVPGLRSCTAQYLKLAVISGTRVQLSVGIWNVESRTLASVPPRTSESQSVAGPGVGASTFALRNCAITEAPRTPSINHSRRLPSDESRAHARPATSNERCATSGRDV